MIKYKFFCDLEFTHLDPMRGQILECALLVTDSSLNVLNEFHVLVRPEIINHVTWDSEAEEYHKITKSQAMAHPYSRREFCMMLLNFLAPYYFECLEPQPFYCHALEFGFRNKGGDYSWPYIDFHMLDWAFRNEGLFYSLCKIISQDRVFSTIKMAKKAGLYGQRIQVDKNGRESNRKTYKLNILCEIMGFKLDHHKATSDTWGCLEVAKYCINSKGDRLL